MELAVAIVVAGIVSLFAIGIISMNARVFHQVESNTISHWDLRKSMRLLRTDIKMIRPQQIDANLTLNSGGSLLVFQDLNGNTITWQRSGGDHLQKKINGGSWLTLLSYMQQNPFRYLDQNLNVTTNMNNLAFIEVTLDTQRDGQTITLQDRFYVRN